MNIQEILTLLSNLRPVFHSEADFQHALAWQIHIMYPDSNVRLELPILIQNYLIHLDLWCATSKRSLAIELKYKTKLLRTNYQGEQFNLTNQAAQDLARYDFIKDIWRLEQIKTQRPNVKAYAIFITNDSSYWNPARNENTIDVAFRIYEGRILNGLLGWGAEAAEGSINGREEPLLLSGNYILNWNDYSNIEIEGNSRFRFLLIKI